MFGADVVADAEPSPSPSADDKEKLKQLPQDQLIDSLLKLQTKLAQKEKKSVRSPGTEIVGRFRTEDWVKQHSREASEKGKSEKTGKPEGEKDDDGWGKKGDDNGWGKKDDGGWGGNW